ncbi:MAG: YceI family protein [Halioglobus sp.]|nr:YceI family protein [Halioglobus sp.]
MNILRIFAPLGLVICLLAPTGVAMADWKLESTQSTINFVSIKNDSVGEVHSFSSLLGYISADGKAQLTINLNSVETLIEVRNERMRELLFETVEFPTATISAQIEPALLAAVVEGIVVTTELPITLSLHGQEKALTVAVVIVGEGDGGIRVHSPRPVLINAGDFGLAAGVQALQKVAGLDAISAVVPVTLQLLFIPAE